MAPTSQSSFSCPSMALMATSYFRDCALSHTVGAQQSRAIRTCGGPLSPSRCLGFRGAPCWAQGGHPGAPHGTCGAQLCGVTLPQWHLDASPQFCSSLGCPAALIPAHCSGGSSLTHHQGGRFPLRSLQGLPAAGSPGDEQPSSDGYPSPASQTPVPTTGGSLQTCQDPTLVLLCRVPLLSEQHPQIAPLRPRGALYKSLCVGAHESELLCFLGHGGERQCLEPSD